MGKAELARLRSSAVTISIGDRQYPAFSSHTCRTCTHPMRALIEEQLLLGEPFAQVARWVSNHESTAHDGSQVDWPVLTAQSLTKHYQQGHCPVDTRVLRAVMAQRAAQLGTGYQEMVERAVDHVVVAKQVLALGQAALVRGEIAPTVRETLSAAKLLHDIESDQGQEQVDRLQDYADAMAVYLDAVMAIMTPDQIRQLHLVLSANPVLAALASKQDVYDAELVES